MPLALLMTILLVLVLVCAPFAWLASGIAGSLVAFHAYGLADTVALGAKPGLALWLLRPLLTFCHGLTAAQVISVVAVLVLIATSTSPSQPGAARQ